MANGTFVPPVDGDGDVPRAPAIGNGAFPPSPREQLLLELINATRLDPFGHASTYISSYNPLTSPDPDIQNALTFFGVSGSALEAAFRALVPAQPLAWSHDLGFAAQNHSDAMIAADSQSHQVPGEPDLGTRANNAGYTGFSALAENIFAFTRSELHGHAAFMVDWGGSPATGGMQSPPGHRNSIMNNNFREIGIGIVEESNAGTSVGPLVVTEDFGNRFALSGRALVLGVAFADGDGDRFYDIGEGQAGVNVGNGVVSATTFFSGDYRLELAPGAHNLTLGAIKVGLNLAADANVKLDVVSGTILKTSTSLVLQGGASQVEAMGLNGLTLTAGAGNQALIGAAGSDLLQGGGDNDLLFASHWLRTVGSGSDTLQGGDGNDAMWGFDGNDDLQGDAGSDGLVGGGGNDLIAGGDGVDFLFGGDFSAVDGSMLPNSGNDTLNGGAGNDGLWGFDGNDAINGDAGDDYAESGAGSDSISGGADNDTLLGQDGADTVGGGSGFDYLYGGAGADVFVFNRGDSYDTVWDFNAAEGDRIRLDPAFGIATLADLQSHLSGFTFDGADYTVIDFPDTVDKLTIKGIAPGAFALGMLDL